MRERNLAFKSDRAQNCLGLKLMRRVGIRVHEGDGDGTHVFGIKNTRRHFDIGALERIVDAAVGEDSAADGEAQPAGHQRRRLAPEQIVHVVAAAAPDFEYVAEAIRREEADHCSLSLQERVQSDSRAVEEEAGATDSIRRETLLNRANHTLVGTLGRGGNLGGANLPGEFIVEDEVREGSTDINPDPSRHLLLHPAQRALLTRTH